MAVRAVWADIGVRVRRFVVHRPAVYWGVVGLAALGAGAIVHARIDDVETHKQRWVLTAPVLVTRTAVEPGQLLSADLVDTVALPVAAVPGGAMADLPEGVVALDHLAAGEVVLTHHTTAGSGPGTLLPGGTKGVAVPTAVVGLPLAVGDNVAVLAIADELGGGGAPGLLCDAAEVVRLVEGAVVLAVPDTAAAPVALAAASGRTVLVLLRAPGLGVPTESSTLPASAEHGDPDAPTEPPTPGEG